MRNRFLTWSELSESLKAKALAKLNRLADAKGRYDGTVLPYAWADRIAPLLRYTLTAKGTAIWDCLPMLSDQKRGLSLFTLPVPELEAK